jgi:hypothetical protein
MVAQKQQVEEINQTRKREEFSLPDCNDLQYVEIQRMFQRNMWSPSSGSKNKTGKAPE